MAIPVLTCLCGPISWASAASERTVVATPEEVFVEADRPVAFSVTTSGYTLTVQPPWGYNRPINAGRHYPFLVIGLWNEAMEKFNEAKRKRYPAFYMSFQYSNESDGQKLSDVLDTLMTDRACRIDLNRIYLTGFSMGGSGSFNLIKGFLSRGKCFAGLIRIAGQSNSVLAEGAIPKLAISMHIGLKDNATRVNVSRQLYANIKNHPANALAVENIFEEPAFGRTTKVLTLDGVDVIRYHEYPEMGHTTATPYSDEALYGWLMSRAIGSTSTSRRQVRVQLPTAPTAWNVQCDGQAMTSSGDGWWTISGKDPRVDQRLSWQAAPADG